jgi:hypothetical protein
MASKLGSGLWIKCHKIALGLTDEKKGPFAESIAVMRLANVLRSDPESIGIDKIARQLWRRYDQLMRPRPGKTGGIYHPQRLIPAANRQRCMMKVAGTLQLKFWEEVENDAFANAREVHEAKIDYIATRLKAFAEYPQYPLLPDVERYIFGHRSPPVETMPPELNDDDDDA